ncbi:UbiA family prenyltransferase [Roseobacter weihaiensis]|uniref:UbiA family prenyltransferase n=1 Tax=Roseobacter weihaiensis TaxID=2763262 RepID=UPI001D0A3AAF|nr:UbiA prenyltransferase family protein [Roseobacter sp. H9]
MRPHEYIGVCIFCTSVGYVLGSNSSLSILLLLLISNIGCLAFAFAFNDLQDIEDDRKSLRGCTRNPLTAGRLSLRSAILICVFCLLASMTASAALGWKAFLANLIGISLAFLYSWRFVRLKAIPVLDVVSHGFFIGTLQFWVALFAVDGQIGDPWAIVLGGAFFMISCLSDLNNEIRDYDADREAGLQNLLSLFDLRKYEALVHYLSACLALGILCMLAFKVSPLAAVSLVALVGAFLGYYLLGNHKDHRRIAFERWSQYCSLAMGIVLVWDKVA